MSLSHIKKKKKMKKNEEIVWRKLVTLINFSTYWFLYRLFFPAVILFAYSEDPVFIKLNEKEGKLKFLLTFYSIQIPVRHVGWIRLNYQDKCRTSPMRQKLNQFLSNISQDFSLLILIFPICYLFFTFRDIFSALTSSCASRITEKWMALMLPIWRSLPF